MISCDECSFDGGPLSGVDLAAAFTGYARKYRAPLTRFLPGEDGPALLRIRPDAGAWSGLEYAAHVRDVFAIDVGRIQRVLTEDRPLLDGFDFEAACEDQRYNDQDPAVVADEVTAAANSMAEVLSGIDDSCWERVGLAGDGSGDERSVRLLAERAAHDGHHHLLDIGRTLRAARAALSG